VTHLKEIKSEVDEIETFLLEALNGFQERHSNLQINGVTVDHVQEFGCERQEIFMVKLDISLI